MSLSDSAETSVLQQIFAGTALPWNGNTNLWLALYTSDPGETGAANAAGEATFGGYARVVMVRATDFTIAGNTVSNATLKQFPACSSGTNTITHAAVVTTASGAGTIVVRATLSSSIVVSTGVQAQFASSALSFTID